ncbi:MAG: hypothetical protein JSW25_00245 [Thermoplasmata archaeon]|nr:MAG: hypothetical protein JSW25_00245 [Thermoplasmata archaeon]
MVGVPAPDEKGHTPGSWRLPAIGLLALMGLLALILMAVPTVADNAPPTAIISSPDDGDDFMVSEAVTFDGSESIDEDPDNLTYEWNISGQIISGPDKAIIQRTFTTTGDVLVVLRVVDVGGRESTTFITIRIRAFNQAPVAIVSSPEEGQRFLNGRNINFDGSDSFDPDGGTLVYRWETNRTIDPIGTTASFSIRLPLGRYQVTLYVFDQVGDPGEAVVNISVEINVPPELSNGRVDPPIGPWDIEGGFNFSVTYRDDDNDPPSTIQVKVGLPGNLEGHPMEPSDPSDQDFRDGVRYHALVRIPAGMYSFVFTARDAFYSCATALYQGPEVYHLQTISFPNIGASVSINWTQLGRVTAQVVVPPGSEPPETVMISPSVRTVVTDGVWSSARLELTYSTGHLVDEDTITLVWYDGGRGLWVPATGQHHDPMTRTVSGDLPSDDVVMAVVGRLSDENVNNPPNLVIRYNIEDAFVGEVLWFDASCSTDPDGSVLLFHWDFTDDGQPGPWVPGVRAPNVYLEAGVHQVVLRAIDGGNEHFKVENVTIRKEREYQPGPWDNPDALFLLASLMVIAFGMAVAYRLRKPRTYDDLFGKAYEEKDDDEYSQLFRKLTEEELRGGPPDEAFLQDWDDEEDQVDEEDGSEDGEGSEEDDEEEEREG